MNYWLDMSRRDYVDDEEAKLRQQTYNLFPERWKQLYEEQPNIGIDGLPEIPITDPRQLDHWFNHLAGQQGMTGAQAERAFSSLAGAGAPPQQLLGYAQGEGRKV